MPQHHLEQAGFAEAVPAANADPHACLKVKVEPLDQLLPAEFKLKVDQVDHTIGQLPRRRNDHLHLQFLVRPLRVFDPVKFVDAKFGLGCARLRTAANPVQLPAQKTLPFQLQRLLVFHAGQIGLEVVRVVALVQIKPTALQLDYVVANLIEKIAVVRRHQKRPAKFFQILRHPLD